MKTYRITPTVPIVGGGYRDLPVEEIRANTEKEAVDCFFETNPQYGERVHARCEEVTEIPIPGYIPTDLDQAVLLVSGIIQERVCDIALIDKDRFLRHWAAILYLHPGLHPDDYSAVDGGWPCELRLVACDAWRRYELEQLKEEEFYCVAAGQARFQRNEPNHEPLRTSEGLKNAVVKAVEDKPIGEFEFKVVAELERRGIECSCEYPGFVLIWKTRWCYGTVNPLWGGNNEECTASIEFDIPSDSEDVGAVATAIQQHQKTL